MLVVPDTPLFSPPQAGATRVISVVLTGGPCAGKSTALVAIRDHFEALGWRVLIMPESATTLSNAGINPFGGQGTPFQRAILGLQSAIEAEAKRYAASIGRNVLIIFDRSMMDGAAFAPAEEFTALLAERGRTRFRARDCEHDAVLHLVTAAKGAREFYTLENNAARTETADQAVAVDERVLAAWVGHPHLRVIGNEGSFKAKILNVLKEIAIVLGVPLPIEQERKFLVRLAQMPALAEASRVRIVQSYLPSEYPVEIRLRQREQYGEAAYIETLKRPVPSSPADRFETERGIVQDEYLARVAGAIASLIKHRHYFPHHDPTTGLHHYLEIDSYDLSTLSPATQRRIPSGPWGIIEVETDIKGPLGFPSWVEVIEEVTGKEEWSNRAMAAPVGLRPVDTSVNACLSRLQAVVSHQDIKPPHVRLD